MNHPEIVQNLLLIGCEVSNDALIIPLDWINTLQIDQSVEYAMTRGNLSDMLSKTTVSLTFHVLDQLASLTGD